MWQVTQRGLIGGCWRSFRPGSDDTGTTMYLACFHVVESYFLGAFTFFQTLFKWFNWQTVVKQKTIATRNIVSSELQCEHIPVIIL